jgi:hypothetical protein
MCAERKRRTSNRPVGRPSWPLLTLSVNAWIRGSCSLGGRSVGLAAEGCDQPLDEVGLVSIGEARFGVGELVLERRHLAR